MSEKICGIYKITNKVNGKVYIGQSRDIEKRWKEHKRAADLNCPLLYKAINKYGVENFSFEIQEICTEDLLNDREIYWIKYYNSCVFFDNGYGYNCNEGGASGCGFTPSEETRMKMREIKLRDGVWCSKPVICGGVEYKSVSDCAKFYNIPSDTMSSWLLGTYTMPKKFYELGLKYRDGNVEYKQREINARRNVSVKIDGIVFDNLTRCSEYLGVSTVRLSGWLEDSMPIDIYNRGLQYVDSAYKKEVKISNLPSSHKHKDIYFDGQRYASFAALARAIGCDAETIRNFINGKKCLPLIMVGHEFIVDGERIDTSKQNRPKKRVKTSRWKQVMFDGVKYDSLQDLADALDVDRATVQRWCRLNQLPKKYDGIEFYLCKEGGLDDCKKK